MSKLLVGLVFVVGSAGQVMAGPRDPASRDTPAPVTEIPAAMADWFGHAVESILGGETGTPATRPPAPADRR